MIFGASSHGFEDLGLWSSDKGRGVRGGRPHPRLEELKEPLRFVGRVEVKVDDDVVGVVDGPVDAVLTDPGLPPMLSESLERRAPEREVDDRVLDVQCWQRSSYMR